MSTINVIKLILCLILLSLSIWTGSLFPLFLIVLFLDTVFKTYYLKSTISKVSQWFRIKIKFLEWVLAAFISVWAFFFLQHNFIEASIINSSSMQGTLMPGDILLVNKLTPGVRTHANNADEFERNAGLSTLKFKDVIVFNFPEGDTLLNSKPTESYYYLRRLYSLSDNKKLNTKDKKYYEVEDRPKYVKRIYGMPGDSIAIEKGIFYRNHKRIQYPEYTIRRYKIKKEEELKKQVNPYDMFTIADAPVWEIFEKDYKKYKDSTSWLQPALSVRNYPEPLIFPFNRHLLWNKDYMGPIYVPKKGVTVKLNLNNIDFYKRIIKVYEGNLLKINDDGIFINGKKAETYTFKMNYYWVMGENRPHSFDSRYWGFVPDNHIIGKVMMILASKDIHGNSFFKLRSNRFFKKIE